MKYQLMRLKLNFYLFVRMCMAEKTAGLNLDKSNTIILNDDDDDIGIHLPKIK